MDGCGLVKKGTWSVVSAHCETTAKMIIVMEIDVQVSLLYLDVSSINHSTWSEIYA